MRLIDVDELGVVRCSKDVLPAAYCAGWNGLIGLIERAPTIDAIPVIRCRECKYYEIHKPKVLENCERKGYIIPMKPDDFCSYGERKEGDE